MRRVLFVAEKNDVAKGVAAILSNGQFNRRDGFSRYNKIYQLQSDVMGQRSHVEVTSVSGHLMEWQFGPEMKNWQRVPIESLFDAPVYHVVTDQMKDIERTLRDLATRNEMLVIWTDCDREGENIGNEIVKVCKQSNRAIDVYRARFSEITPAAIHRAKNNLVRLDQHIVDAVDCRAELDLRIGASFTRLQTLYLLPRFTDIFNDSNAKRIVSYGPCQFPTLGFVVERYKQYINFVREPFWKLVLTHKKGNVKAEFLWDRVHLFDREVVAVLHDECRESDAAVVDDIISKPKSKYRPVALDTVEFEKLAVRKLKMSAKMAMNIAEKLYSQGWISYPRTETNIFPKTLDLNPLVQAQTASGDWGEFAQEVVAEGPNPRNGNKSDEAHPPIHPLRFATKDQLGGNEWRVYELVTRHFLACVSSDAKGHETIVKVHLGSEKFHATGLQVLDMGYLKVYVYDKWGDKTLPVYAPGEQIRNYELTMSEGQTSPPDLLTEADLIALMDKYGIGTDATHAEHIERIKEREYVGLTQDNKFIPSFLGLALVDGYDDMGFKMSKPDLRANLERGLVDICEGRKAKNEVLNDYRIRYRRIFDVAAQQVHKLAEFFRRYLTHGVQPANANNNGNGNNDGGNGPAPGGGGNGDGGDDEDGPGPGQGPNRGNGHTTTTAPFGNTSASGGAQQPLSLLPSVASASGRGGSTAARGGRGGGRAGGTSGRGKKKSDSEVANIPTHAVVGRARTTTTARRPRGSRGRGGAAAGQQRKQRGNDENGDGEPSHNQTCSCGLTASLLTVKKEGPNKGRQFYACPKGMQAPDKCQFFLWAT